MEFNDILNKFDIKEEVYKDTFTASCPVCNNNGNLLVGFIPEEGKTYLRCFNGCTSEQICNALNIKENDLYAESLAPYSEYFKTLDEFEEKEARWLIKDWLPEGQITLLAADGGVGKTTLWCNIAAAISSGKQCILDKESCIREPGKVLVFTTEDSISYMLLKKLRLAGAVLKNIKAFDIQQDKTGEALTSLVFGSSELSKTIRAEHPTLCIFDPVQGFLDPNINMGSRNAMRQALAPLIALGEECGTTFLIVCHSNKRKGASGRDRIADSADLWDIARSVIMMGYTQEQGIRYLSNEKNNYTIPPQTILFGINNGQVEYKGATDKHDKDYMLEGIKKHDTTPQRDDCRQFIIDTLKACEDNKISSAELLQAAKDEGYSAATIKRTKEEMKELNQIIIKREGGIERGGGKWYTCLGEIWTELPEWEQTPFDFSEDEKL